MDDAGAALFAGGGLLLGWASWLLASWLTAGAAPTWRPPAVAPWLCAVAGGAVLAAVALRGAADLGQMLLTALLLASLLVTLVTDLLARLVYPPVMLAGAVVALGGAWFGPDGVMPHLQSGVIIGIVASLIAGLAQLGWGEAESPLGSGDVLIATLIGLAFGPGLAIRVLVAGIVLGGLVAAALLISGRARRHDVLPYGACLCAAAIAALALSPIG